MRPKLSELGIVEGGIAECIVTTYNEDGSPNAAPMGITASGENEVTMQLHTDNDTYSNLIRNGGCAINIVHDPLVFLRATLMGGGKGGAEPEVAREEVSRCGSVDAPYLKDASAHLEALLGEHYEFVKEDRHGRSSVSRVKCEILAANVKTRHPVALNRGLNAAIELAIHLSRGEKEGIEEYLGVMKKTLPRQQYDNIMSFLKIYI
ncbi:MAG: DUF447 domain-containing protein [Candidatus Hydrothermarchaeaceae archaeon]